MTLVIASNDSQLDVAPAVHYQNLVDWLAFELGVIGGND